ncbi:uncharacterized protein LOC131596087 [Vicia villosa]|uniref:uncharacterized protein LOC131596087 n=1 Tax=Vicia villosa TaxID=3911 RepID=UPI00273C8B21|nr:uncharacterized protein LOC131596087 [Vicia villosa]
MVSWNVRGLNKVGKIKEICSRLHEIKPTVMILLESRVKREKVDMVRDKLHLTDHFVDNYGDLENGRIWVGWNGMKVEVQLVLNSSQLVHCREIEKIHKSITGPWCVIGDFNNIARAHDRIGGKLVTEKEYIDMQNMMMKTGLSEMDSSWDYFTWFNKHTIDPIYSRIDRLIVEDKPKRQFRFSNCLEDMVGFNDVVHNSWKQNIGGTPMMVLWKKLKRLQNVLRRFSRPLTYLKQDLAKARDNLTQAQTDLNNNRWDVNITERVNICTEK